MKKNKTHKNKLKDPNEENTKRSKSQNTKLDTQKKKYLKTSKIKKI